MDLSTNTQNKANLADQATNGAIVRTLDKNGFTSISGFIFDIIENEDITISSDITDHYIENNSSIQDHIALKPEKFTLRGFVAELKDVFTPPTFSFPTQINLMPLLEFILPSFTSQAILVYGQISDTYDKISNALNQSQDNFSLQTQKSTTTSEQQLVYKYFYDLWYSRVLCSIETPFGVFDSMAIESLRAMQPGESRYVGDFSVTFKKIRKAQVTKAIIASLARDRAANMYAPIAPKGQTPGQSFVNSNLSLSFPSGAGK
jgi:hypothetical protein